MDVSLYEVVLSYRRGERLSDAIEYGFTEAQLALRRDMAAGRLIWYENWLQDWWCFLRNTHPVFAAFASHQLHVVGKLERYWIYFMLICAYWLMAALAVETHECLLEPTCDPLALANATEGFLKHVALLYIDLPDGRDDGSYLYAAPEAGSARAGREPPDMYMCCMCEDLGLVWLYRSWGGGGVATVFAIASIVVGQLWFLLAACGCCQHKEPKVRHRWERLAHWSLFLSGLTAAAVFAVSYNYMQRAGLLGAAWLNFIVVKGISICGAFVFQSSVFVGLYRKQRAMSQEQLAARFYVTAADVRKCEHVRRKLGLPPLDQRFRLCNEVLPDGTKAEARWRHWLQGRSLRQLVLASATCVCGLWLVATALAAVAFLATYIEHRRHYYPRLYAQDVDYENSTAAQLERNGSVVLPVLDVIRGGGGGAHAHGGGAGAGLAGSVLAAAAAAGGGGAALVDAVNSVLANSTSAQGAAGGGMAELLADAVAGAARAGAAAGENGAVAALLRLLAERGFHYDANSTDATALAAAEPAAANASAEGASAHDRPPSRPSPPANETAAADRGDDGGGGRRRQLRGRGRSRPRRS